MLAVIHRTVLGQGPPHFQTFFQRDLNAPQRITRVSYRRHTKQLVEYRGQGILRICQRSALGLIFIYNMLPQQVVDCNSVKKFQALLQKLVRIAAEANHPNWSNLFSSRIATVGHPLLSFDL